MSPLNLHFFEKCKFFNNFWNPKWAQNRLQNELKSISEKNTFSDKIFNRNFVVLASQNDAKIEDFSNPYRKLRFRKNRAPV